MSFELVLYSSGVHARVSKRAGGAGKWSEVCGGHFLSLLDLSPGLQTRPRRTSHLLSLKKIRACGDEWRPCDGAAAL